MADFKVAFHIFAEFDAIHFGHHHVGHNQVYVFILKDSDAFFPVFGFEHIVLTT